MNNENSSSTSQNISCIPLEEELNQVDYIEKQVKEFKSNKYDRLTAKIEERQHVN